MKKQIGGFLFGALFGGVVIFTIGAGSQHPQAWDYKVAIEDLKYNQQDYYADALNQVATNGWEVISTQIVPKSREVVSTESAGVYIILRHPK